MSTDFAKRLKAARAHAGLTQEELAAKAGLKQSSIGDLESKG
ncbi:helix-turn-helix transcriptional regulator, partial [Delftia acidovorans]